MLELGKYHRDVNPLSKMEKNVIKERVDAMTEEEVTFILSVIPSDYLINEINNRLKSGTFDKSLFDEIV